MFIGKRQYLCKHFFFEEGEGVEVENPIFEIIIGMINLNFMAVVAMINWGDNPTEKYAYTCSLLVNVNIVKYYFHLLLCIKELDSYRFWFSIIIDFQISRQILKKIHLSAKYHVKNLKRFKQSKSNGMPKVQSYRLNGVALIEKTYMMLT